MREQDKYRITTAEMKFVGRRAKYTWQDYRTNGDILSELKIKKKQKASKHILQLVRLLLLHQG
jgi:hypothetical protein